MFPHVRSKSVLAGGDVQADGARVVVLEVLKAQATVGTKLVALRGACSTVTRGDHVAVAGHWREVAGVLFGLGARVVRRALLGSRAEVVDRDGAFPVEGEVGRLEVALLGEEEDEAASLALIGLRNIEVVHRASGPIDLPVVRCTVGLIWVLRRDGNDQVRVLIVALQICRAGRALASRSGLRLGCHSLSAHSLGSLARSLGTRAVLVSLKLGDILSDWFLRGFSLLNRLCLVHSSGLLSSHGCLFDFGLVDSRLLRSRLGLLLGLGRVNSGRHDLSILNRLGFSLVDGSRLVLGVLLGLCFLLINGGWLVLSVLLRLRLRFVDGGWLVLGVLLHLRLRHCDCLRSRAGVGLHDSRGNGLLRHSRRSRHGL